VERKDTIIVYYLVLNPYSNNKDGVLRFHSLSMPPRIAKYRLCCEASIEVDGIRIPGPVDSVR